MNNAIVEVNNKMGKTRGLFKKTGEIKGTFHARWCIKDRNGMDLTEAEDINKRWQVHTRELYKKDLIDLGKPWWCDHSPRTKHPGVWSQVGLQIRSDQISRSVVSDSLRTMNCSTPGLPVHHQLPEFTETHVHWVGDAIQLSHPLSSPSPPTLNPSQHQSLFQWVTSSHEVAKVLEFQL